MSRLLISDPPLCVSPRLAEAFGLNEAIALQQIHYWLEKAKEGRAYNYQDGRWWVYNTIENWRKENFPFWSESTIRRTFSRLQDMGILLVGNYNKTAFDRTHWYSIDYDELTKLLNSILAKETNGSEQTGDADLGDVSEPIPETTRDYTEISGDALLDSFGLHGPGWPERGKIPKTRPASEQPWLECAPWLRTRDGISAESLQHVYWLLRDTTGLEPTDGERPGWAKALAMVYQAANGNFAAMERGMRAVWARERQYRPGHARGFVDEVRKAARPVEMDPEKAEFERCRAAMEADPQYQMFKGTVKYD